MLAETLGSSESLLVVRSRAFTLDTRDKAVNERVGLANTSEVCLLAASGTQAAKSAGKRALWNISDALSGHESSVRDGDGSGESKDGLHFECFV